MNIICFSGIIISEPVKKTYGSEKKHSFSVCDIELSDNKDSFKIGLIANFSVAEDLALLNVGDIIEGHGKIVLTRKGDKVIRIASFKKIGFKEIDDFIDEEVEENEKELPINPFDADEMPF